MKVEHSPLYVTALSNDFASGNEANTAGFFTNRLGEELYFPGRENWHVAVHHVQFSNFFPETNLRILKIKTDLAISAYCPDGIFTIIPKKNADSNIQRIVNHQPENKEFFPLRSEAISTISIQVLDADNRQLLFPTGQPSVVIFEFRRMPNKNSHIVRVESRLDPAGNASDFEASPPSLLALDPAKKWKVALSSLSYTGSFVQNIPLEGDPHLEMIYKSESGEKESLRVKLGDGQTTFPNNMILYDQFNAGLEQLKIPDLIPQTIARTSPQNEIISNFRDVRLNPLNNRIAISSRKACLLRIPFGWALMLGCDGNPDEYGYVEVGFKTLSTVQFKNPVNCNVWIPNSMLVYTNFIEFSPVGSILAPLLRTIPLEKLPNGGQYSLFEPKDEEEHPVIFSQLTSLRFQIRRVDGQPIKFTTHFPSNIIISLKFTQIE